MSWIHLNKFVDISTAKRATAKFLLAPHIPIRDYITKKKLNKTGKDINCLYICVTVIVDWVILVIGHTLIRLRRLSNWSHFLPKVKDVYKQVSFKLSFSRNYLFKIYIYLVFGIFKFLISRARIAGDRIRSTKTTQQVIDTYGANKNDNFFERHMLLGFLVIAFSIYMVLSYLNLLGSFKNIVAWFEICVFFK